MWIVGDDTYVAYHIDYQLLDKIIYLIWWFQLPTNIKKGPLVVPYMFLMSHNNGVMINLESEPLFESKDFPLDDDEGDGGWSKLHPMFGKTINDSNIVPCPWISCPFHGEP